MLEHLQKKKDRFTTMFDGTLDAHMRFETTFGLLLNRRKNDAESMFTLPPMLAGFAVLSLNPQYVDEHEKYHFH